MTDKFQNKYRIPSARLPNWDYGSNAAYFITICTKNREHFFGEIKHDVMHLSNMGVIADILWYEIKNHAKHIELGEFVVMPNHVHGIIILNGNDKTEDSNDLTGSDGTDGSGGADGSVSSIDPVDPHVETGHALSLQMQMQSQSPNQPEKTFAQQRFQNQGKNTLSSIVGGYKSAVTKHANRLKFNFAWQSRFHDHIIRDDKSFYNISEYIKNNPSNWKDDEWNKPLDGS